MDIPEDTDPYVVGELLKEYFRDLKKPLCTYKRYESFDRVNGTMPNNRCLDFIFAHHVRLLLSSFFVFLFRHAVRQAASRASRLHRRPAQGQKVRQRLLHRTLLGWRDGD
jgi:hypothetical protein